MRHGVQLLHHHVRDDDGLVLQAFRSSGVPLCSSMFDDILEIIGHPSIHNIEEVISLWKPSLGELIGEVPHEVSVLLEVRP
jgi:hypothetical protein